MEDLKSSNNTRKDHNNDLINRMRKGESLTSYDSSSSWFPPRPIIKKDAGAVTSLYGENVQTLKGSGEEKTGKSERRLLLVIDGEAS